MTPAFWSLRPALVVSYSAVGGLQSVYVAVIHVFRDVDSPSCRCSEESWLAGSKSVACASRLEPGRTVHCPAELPFVAHHWPAPSAVQLMEVMLADREDENRATSNNCASISARPCILFSLSCSWCPFASRHPFHMRTLLCLLGKNGT